MDRTIAEPVLMHETGTHQFFVQSPGMVIAKEKGGNGSLDLFSVSVEALLMLEIAQTLQDIRTWGIAQNQEAGQAVYNRR
jgi:hypothetical protein